MIMAGALSFERALCLCGVLALALIPVLELDEGHAVVLATAATSAAAAAGTTR